MRLCSQQHRHEEVTPCLTTPPPVGGYGRGEAWGSSHDGGSGGVSAAAWSGHSISLLYSEGRKEECRWLEEEGRRGGEVLTWTAVRGHLSGDTVTKLRAGINDSQQALHPVTSKRCAVVGLPRRDFDTV